MHESDKPNNNQKLSQLMDGEWHELDSSDCVVSLCSDEALRAKWARYHMIRDVLKNETVHVDQALTRRICDAIRDEPSYTNIAPFSGAATSQPVSQTEVAPSEVAPSEVAQSTTTPVETAAPAASKNSWFNTGIAGFALAASVALVTVVGVNLLEQQSSPTGSPLLAQTASVENPAPLVQDSSVVLPVVDFVSNTRSYWVSPESAQRVSDEGRLNMMLSQHIENSPTSGRGGLLPYSRLVGYEEVGQNR